MILSVDTVTLLFNKVFFALLIHILWFCFYTNTYMYDLPKYTLNNTWEGVIIAILYTLIPFKDPKTDLQLECHPSKVVYKYTHLWCFRSGTLVISCSTEWCILFSLYEIHDESQENITLFHLDFWPNKVTGTWLTFQLNIYLSAVLSHSVLSNSAILWTTAL